MKTKKIQKSVILALAILTCSILFLAAGPANAQPKDIVETAVEAGSFKTLAAALQAAGLVDALKGEGPFTVFAPTDSAFAKLPAGTVESLLNDIPKLKSILLYHVVSGKIESRDIKNSSNPATLEGGKLKIRTKNGVTVNDATVVTADVQASNGVIHVIDTVLIPKK
jgi:uncharacterized surface protein with fasciclin (FAS1) repeats